MKKKRTVEVVSRPGFSSQRYGVGYIPVMSGMEDATDAFAYDGSSDTYGDFGPDQMVIPIGLFMNGGATVNAFITAMLSEHQKSKPAK